MKLSIVTTIYGTASFINEFYDRCVAAAEAITSDFEIIFVNDGTPDNGLAVALDLYEKDRRVVVVDLSRNFGHHKALMTGLQHARGELIFLIDGDLEERPELLSVFHERLALGDCDVVFGVQARRRGGFVERVTGEAFYWLFRKLCAIDMPRNAATARLMTRRFVQSLLQHRDREISSFIALCVLTGFKQVPVPITKESIKPSSYSFTHKLRLSIDIITAYSVNLLYYLCYLGIFIAGLAFLALVYSVGIYLTTGQVLAGWTSLFASIWAFGGLFMLLIGIIGSYIARIFVEVKDRPYTIARTVYAHPPVDSATGIEKTDGPHASGDKTAPAGAAAGMLS